MRREYAAASSAAGRLAAGHVRIGDRRTVCSTHWADPNILRRRQVAALQITRVERNSASGALKLLKRASLARSEAAVERIGRQGVAAKFSMGRRGKNMVGAKLREDN